MTKYQATQHSTTFRVYSQDGRSDRDMKFIVDHNGTGWQAQRVSFDDVKGFGVNRVGEVIRVHPNDRFDYDKIANELGV